MPHFSNEEAVNLIRDIGRYTYKKLSTDDLRARNQLINSLTDKQRDELFQGCNEYKDNRHKIISEFQGKFKTESEALHDHLKTMSIPYPEDSKYFRSLYIAYLQQARFQPQDITHRQTNASKAYAKLNKVQDVFGQALCRLAFQEEANDPEFRRKVFNDAVVGNLNKNKEHHRAQRVIEILGPSSTGKTSTAKAAIGDDEPHFVIDGAITRAASQMGNVTRNLFTNLGYSGAKGVYRLINGEFPNMKKIIRDIAMTQGDNGLSIVIPTTGTGNIKRWFRDFFAYQKKAGEHHEMIRILVLYPESIKKSGQDRAWENGPLAKHELTYNEPHKESKEYNQRGFNLGRIKSIMSEFFYRRFAQVDHSSIFINDWKLYTKKEGAWVAAKEGDTDVQVISEAVFNKWSKATHTDPRDLPAFAKDPNNQTTKIYTQFEAALFLLSRKLNDSSSLKQSIDTHLERGGVVSTDLIASVREEMKKQKFYSPEIKKLCEKVLIEHKYVVKKNASDLQTSQQVTQQDPVRENISPGKVSNDPLLQQAVEEHYLLRPNLRASSSKNAKNNFERMKENFRNNENAPTLEPPKMK